jgi:hypothetical protein
VDFVGSAGVFPKADTHLELSRVTHAVVGL